MAASMNFHQIKKIALAYYQKQSSRQRSALIAAIIISAILLVYVLLLHPALTFSHNARLALDKERATLNFVQQHADQIRQTNAARQAKTGQDTTLLTLASKTASEHSLTLQRYEPSADGKLGIWLSETEFNTLLTWVDQLIHQYDVQIDRISITQSTKPGTVEAQLVLRQ